ncbi:unnamed protein product [Sphenostylis stenocarpa]|uniref:Uncharacterized protein n=1 Tax=Sphenostylis stenocarpa TaxID=92480 RepID=A0AA86S2W2_9FABA|nr:unnamed protein product [Sphenostylis stenocarpa]
MIRRTGDILSHFVDVNMVIIDSIVQFNSFNLEDWNWRTLLFSLEDFIVFCRFRSWVFDSYLEDFIVRFGVPEPVPVGNCCSWNILEIVDHPVNGVYVDGWFDVRYVYMVVVFQN